MKISVGSHPDLPFPFSNGPEPPTEQVRGLPEPPPLASIRYAHGRDNLAALMNHWFGRSGLSHRQLIAIADWGMGETKTIDNTAISRIRNGLQPRAAGIKHLDALACANRAIWIWQTQGERAAWAQLGPNSSWGIENRTLDGAIWLPDPDKETQPLGLAGFVDLIAGYSDLPYLTTSDFSPSVARQVSDALAHLLEEVIADQGWGPRAGIKQLLAAYPVTDQARQRRLRELILGDRAFSRDELEAELAALATMVATIRELKPEDYGPAELLQELKSGRRPQP